MFYGCERNFFEKKFLSRSLQKTLWIFEDGICESILFPKVFGRFLRTFFSKKVLKPAERGVRGSAPHHTANSEIKIAKAPKIYLVISVVKAA